MLKITGHKNLDLIVIQPQYIQGHLYAPDLQFLLRLQHPRYPIIAEIEDFHALQLGQLGIWHVRQLIVVQIEMRQMGHPVSKYWQIDLLQAVLSKIEDLQERETDKSIGW